jgi:hypothetical protein
MVSSNWHSLRALLRLQGVDAVEAARTEMLHATRHKEGEHLRWISASRSQGSDSNAALVAGDLQLLLHPCRLQHLWTACINTTCRVVA